MSFCPLKGPQENGCASYLPPLIKLVVIIASLGHMLLHRMDVSILPKRERERERERTHHGIIILFYFAVRNSKMLTHDFHIKIQMVLMLFKCVFYLKIY